jgi:3-hexulose-6-phosphate synthase
MTKLQLAIDLVPMTEFKQVITPLLPFVDVIEAGTPLIKRYGLDAVRGLRKLAPDHLLVADMKTMDAGALEAEMAFTAGADLMTVLGCAGDASIAAAAELASRAGMAIVVDMIGVGNKATRAREAVALGANWLGVHTGTDDQAHGADPLADLAQVRAAVDAQIAVAGGINERTLPTLLEYLPEIVIVGSGILAQPDPVAAARRLHEIITAHRVQQ